MKVDHHAQRVTLPVHMARELASRWHDQLLPCLEADLITTTTEVLARKFRELNPRVEVLPNCLDLNLWKKLPSRKESY